MNRRRILIGAAIVLGALGFVLIQALGGQGDSHETTPVPGVARHGSAQGASPDSTPQPPSDRSPSNGGASAVHPESGAGKKPWKTMPPATVSPPRRESQPLSGVTISVDPGHNGGNFTHPEEIAQPVPAGANGTTKACNTTGTETNDGTLTEAEFNWDVARDLVPRLEQLGATVVLTRETDTGVGPCVDRRAEIANRAHAAVAVSIHADGNEAEDAHGFDVIHATTEEMVAPSMATPSLKLAEDVRDALVAAGVPPANYVGEDGLDARSDLAGLNLARVPAVLVELGNMRSAEEAAKLEDPAYRGKLANALAAGIVSFVHHG